jgi:hypothetical protein
MRSSFSKQYEQVIPAFLSAVLTRQAQHLLVPFVSQATSAKHWVFAGETKEIVMRKLLISSAAIIAATLAAAPAAAQYYGYGYSPYSYSYSPYSYGYSPYSYGYSSYGYSPYSYGYSYPSYSYGYSYPSVSFGYSNYGYSHPHRYSSYGCRVRQHHRNGVVYYTRDC